MVLYRAIADKDYALRSRYYYKGIDRDRASPKISTLLSIDADSTHSCLEAYNATHSDAADIAASPSIVTLSAVLRIRL